MHLAFKAMVLIQISEFVNDELWLSLFWHYPKRKIQQDHGKAYSVQSHPIKFGYSLQWMTSSNFITKQNVLQKLMQVSGVPLSSWTPLAHMCF